MPDSWAKLKEQQSSNISPNIVIINYKGQKISEEAQQTPPSPGSEG